MPTISRFFGIVIEMYWNEHVPPHFHALYAGSKAAFTIDPPGLFSKHFPVRAASLVLEWAAAHRGELLENWARARLKLPLNPVPPLE